MADKGTSLGFTVCRARTLFRPHPQPLSHRVAAGCRGACFFALTPSPSPTLWARGTVCRVRTLFRPHPQLVRVHSLGSLWTGSARFSALTPSPSPTMWERGEPSADMFGVLKRQLQHQAEAALPHSTIPLSRLAGEGDKGGEGKKARLPAHASAGGNRPCRSDSVPNRCTLISSPPAPLPRCGRGVSRARTCLEC